jgi:hypothetical protein
MGGAQLSVVDTRGRLWGLLAEFETVESLLAAVTRVREEGYTRFDAHAPVPVHGIDEAMGIRMSKLPWVVAGGGLAGASLGLLMQWWMNAYDYPFLISGKPLFGLPAAIPITFELTVLLGSIGAVLGLIVVTGFPRLHHPLFSSARFRRSTSDRFFVSIEAEDPRFERAGTRALLESLAASHVEEINDDDRHRAPGSGHREEAATEGGGHAS